MIAQNTVKASTMPTPASSGNTGIGADSDMSSGLPVQQGIKAPRLHQQDTRQPVVRQLKMGDSVDSSMGGNPPSGSIPHPIPTAQGQVPAALPSGSATVGGAIGDGGGHSRTVLNATETGVLGTVGAGEPCLGHGGKVQ